MRVAGTRASIVVVSRQSTMLLLMLARDTWVRTTATLLFIAAVVISSSSDDDHQRIINNHLQEGNDALSNGDFISAIRSYEECLILDPNNRYCNINYASALVDDDDTKEDRSVRTRKAIEILRHVMTLHPKDGDAAFNLALLLQDMSKSIEHTRESASLYQIAVESMEEQEQEQAGQIKWDALANLAASRQELGIHFGTYGSLRCYERAIVHLEGLTQQYNTYIDHMINDHDAGSREYDEEGYQHAQTQVLEMNVYTSKLYYGYGTILSELSSSDCVRLMDEEGSLLFDTERTTTLKIRTVSEQKQQQEQQAVEESAKEVCVANAINALRMAVNLDGNNAVAAHMLTAITGSSNDDEVGYTRPERASNAFVSALFDDFADTFDEKLGALAYQVPQLIGQAAYDLLRMTHRDTFDSILDAGCGTGLAGRFLRPLVSGPLVGIDLSKLMLNKAKECTLTKGCGFKPLAENGNDKTDDDNDDDTVNARENRPLYDNLVLSDLETATLTDLTLDLSSTDDKAMAVVGGFDLIVAADVFVYMGNLEKILHTFAKLMKIDDSMESFLIFSCERIDEDNDDDESKDRSNNEKHQQGWKVQTSGRYAHSKIYVTEEAENAGFELVRYDKIIPRMEKGKEVQGHLFVFGIGGVRLVEVDRLNADYGVHVQFFNDNDSHLEDRDPAMDEL